MDVLSPGSLEMSTALDIFDQHPFANLMVHDPHSDFPQVVHLPFLFVHDEQCFYAHASANNPIFKLMSPNNHPVKLIFNAEHGYVSPTWTSHIKVPTWDYCVIHVSGDISVVDDPVQKQQSMVEQIGAFETSWQLDDLEPSPRERMFNSIKVIKIAVTAMHYRYKMSQNKPLEAKAAIVENFAAQGQRAVVARYEALF